MKKLIISILLLSFSPVFFSGCNKTDNKDKDNPTSSITIDSDMVESYDDGIAFMMLLGSNDVQVNCVTTATMNVWAQEGLAYAIRLGELCGGKDVIYAAGSQYPFRQNRLDTIDEEIDASPGIDSDWRGAVSYPEVTDWKSFYIERYARDPQIQPSADEASELIYNQVISSPGEMVILAIGACTNIAKAIANHPDMASKAKEIIYMGGAVYCPGNTTTYAEMNFLYDPEAAAICLRAPFPKQTIVSLDICNTVQMDKEKFMSIYDSVKSEEIRSLIRNNYPYSDYEANPSRTQPAWDIISAAIALDPTIISEYEDVRLDVDDNPESPTYGKSFVSDNQLRQTVRIPTEIDQNMFWSIVKREMSKY